MTHCSAQRILFISGDCWTTCDDLQHAVETTCTNWGPTVLFSCWSRALKHAHQMQLAGATPTNCAVSDSGSATAVSGSASAVSGSASVVSGSASAVSGSDSAVPGSGSDSAVSGSASAVSDSGSDTSWRRWHAPACYEVCSGAEQRACNSVAQKATDMEKYKNAAWGPHTQSFSAFAFVACITQTMPDGQVISELELHGANPNGYACVKRSKRSKITCKGSA
eukprot:363620-Chlamydomonas_euryale.AAC.12